MRFMPGCSCCPEPSCETDAVTFCVYGTGTLVPYPDNPYGPTCPGTTDPPNRMPIRNITYVANPVYAACADTGQFAWACNTSGSPTSVSVAYKIEYIAGVWTLRVVSGTYFEDGSTVPFYVDITPTSVSPGPPLEITWGPFDIQGSFYDGVTTFSWYAYEDVVITATTEPCTVCCEVADDTETTITIPSGPLAGDYTATWSGGTWVYFANPPFVLLQLTCTEGNGFFVLSYTYDNGTDFVSGTVPVYDFSCVDPIYFTVPPVP